MFEKDAQENLTKVEKYVNLLWAGEALLGWNLISALRLFMATQARPSLRVRVGGGVLCGQLGAQQEHWHSTTQGKHTHAHWPLTQSPYPLLPPNSIT